MLLNECLSTDETASTESIGSSAFIDPTLERYTESQTLWRTRVEQSVHYWPGSKPPSTRGEGRATRPSFDEVKPSRTNYGLSVSLTTSRYSVLPS